MDDYGSIMQSGFNLVPDMQQQLLRQAQIGNANAAAEEHRAQAAAEAQKASRAQQFQQDIHTFDGSPQSASSLIMKYPEFADELKKGWDVHDGAKKQSDLTQLGEIYTAAQSGNWELAKKVAHARADAEKAAGHEDPGYTAAMEVLDKAADGDPTQQKVVLNLLGAHIAAVTGPEHFGTVYGALKGGVHVVPMGGILTDDEGKTIAHSPLIQDASGNIRSWQEGGDPSSPGVAATAAPGMTEAVASVASTLGSSLPAPVVAGFLGNFHVEGGYTGAQGDGGSASGIAQWHNDRAAQFQKVIGKPVTEATPEEQAKFVLWEMQNPEAAGMTVKQRDAILAAKTPAQAAALIDQYYERSDGKARKGRMAAADAFAGLNGGGKFPVLIPGKQPEPKDSFRILTPAEAQAQGLDPAIKYQVNAKTGQVTALGGQARQAKQIQQTTINKVQPMVDVRDTLTRLNGSFKSDFGGHAILGDNLNSIQGLVGSVGPDGMRDWWADFKNMDNLVRNQLFGSALTEHEKKAYEATTISPKMDPAQIKKNLARRLSIIKAATARQQNFLKKNGHDPEAVDALFQPLGDYGGPSGGSERKVVRTGVQKSTGQRVVQYSDGTIEVK